MMEISFEVWVKEYFKECDLGKLPSGIYRNASTKQLEAGFKGAKEMIAKALMESLDRRAA